MPAKKRVSSRSLKSDLAKVDAHVIKVSEYEDLPELTEDMLARWKATGPGWQTRMAERLSRMR
jgi:uncharacterized protein (DUF4415 family)